VWKWKAAEARSRFHPIGNANFRKKIGGEKGVLFIASPKTTSGQEGEPHRTSTPS